MFLCSVEKGRFSVPAVLRAVLRYGKPGSASAQTGVEFVQNRAPRAKPVFREAVQRRGAGAHQVVHLLRTRLHVKQAGYDFALRLAAFQEGEGSGAVAWVIIILAQFAQAEIGAVMLAH